MPSSDYLASPDAVRINPAASGLPDLRLNQLLGQASAAFRSQTRQHISLVTDDELILDSDGSTTILLPETPVVSVTSISVDGSPILSTGIWSRTGILRRTERWPRAFRQVTVVYSHGYDPVPEDVQEAIIEAVLIKARTSPGQSSGLVTTGPFTYSFNPGVTASWDAAVKAYRRRG